MNVEALANLAKENAELKQQLETRTTIQTDLHTVLEDWHRADLAAPIGTKGFLSERSRDARGTVLSIYRALRNA